MLAAVLIATAVLAQQASSAPVATPAVAGPSPEGMQTEVTLASPHLMALHAERAQGPRDPVWSPETEAALSRAYRDIPGFVEGLDALTVACSAALCEVQAVSRSDLSDSSLEIFMDGMSVPAFTALERALSLRFLVQTANAAPDDAEGAPRTATIVSFWERAPTL